MDIKTISSSSKGCCYVVEDGGKQLIIEAGVSINKLREALDFDFSKVAGCLISHRHGDHCQYANQYENSGIKIWAPKGVILQNHLLTAHCIEDYPRVKIGGVFSCLAIELEHDVKTYGFLIESGEEKLLYVTDTGSISNYFPGLTHLMIEANHSLESLIATEQNKKLVERIADNHLDIDQAVQFAEKHKSDLVEVHLIHLSDLNSDAELFKNQMTGVLGVPVYISDK